MCFAHSYYFIFILMLILMWYIINLIVNYIDSILLKKLWLVSNLSVIVVLKGLLKEMLNILLFYKFLFQVQYI